MDLTRDEIVAMKALGIINVLLVANDGIMMWAKPQHVLWWSFVMLLNVAATIAVIITMRVAPR